MSDDPGVTEVPEHTCWMLLRSVEVARLAVSVDAQPDIFPINFVVDHGTVVFRTDEGSKFAAMMSNRLVAFEVDGYDAAAPRRSDAAPFEGVEFCCRAGELCHERFPCPISPPPL